MEEEWRVIPDYPHYMVSSLGNIMSTKRNKRIIMSKVYSGKSRKIGKVKLWKEGKYRTFNVSTIVGNVFLGRKEGQITKHKTDNFKDDSVSNLYLLDLSI